MKDGILIINKPQHWTSHDCVAVCRRASGVRKVGHGGTLDPMAEGLLPLFIGGAAKITEYLDLDYKKYRCTAKLGLVTDTQDIWGTALRTCGTDGITADDIRKNLLRFRGRIQQIPPKYSAVRVNGKRLYQYARDGEDVEAKARTVHVRSLDILDIDEDCTHVTFDVTCSKGTYIRSICSDLGETLGCGAAMAALCRTESGVFTLENAIPAEALKSMTPVEIESRILDIDVPLVHLGRAEMHADRAKYFCNGNAIRWAQVRVIRKPDEKNADVRNSRGRSYGQLYCVYDVDRGKFLGIGYYSSKEHELKPDKIFERHTEYENF